MRGERLGGAGDAWWHQGVSEQKRIALGAPLGAVRTSSTSTRGGEGRRGRRTLNPRWDTHACSCWGSGWACQKIGKMMKLLANKAQGGLKMLGWGLVPIPGLGGVLSHRGLALWLGATPEGAWGRAEASSPSPVVLGAAAQGKPPLGCSGSPRSRSSRGLGLYSRLGREEASRILEGREYVSRSAATLALRVHVGGCVRGYHAWEHWWGCPGVPPRLPTGWVPLNPEASLVMAARVLPPHRHPPCIREPPPPELPFSRSWAPSDSEMALGAERPGRQGRRMAFQGQSSKLSPQRISQTFPLGPVGV